MGGRFQGMSEGWEHGVVGMAAVVGRRTWGERGPFALARLQLSSSLLSCSVHAVPSPHLYLLWRLPRALPAFARRQHWFFTSGGVVWGRGGKVLLNLAMSSLAAIPWLVKAPPGLLPRGLFALEDALTFSDAC